jgi:hypothetical protein
MLARVQPLLLRPLAEGGHGGRYLREIGPDQALQIVDTPLMPPIDLECCQSSNPDQYVNRSDEMAIGKGHLGRFDRPVFELAPNRCRHEYES